MLKPKLIRITTVPISLEKLLGGQLTYMQNYYEVTAISAEKEKLEALGKEQGFETLYIEMTRKITPLKDIAAVYKLYRFLKKEKPEIVHTHTPKAGIVGMLAAWLAGVPNRLHTVAGLPLMEATGIKRKVLGLVEKMTYACATQVYPNSIGLNDFIIKNNYTKTTKCKVLANGSSNGINTQYFDSSLFLQKNKEELMSALSITPQDFVFIFVGRLVADKGINELISAFKSLSEGKKKTKLLLVGPLETALDPLKPETLETIKSNPNIATAGYQQDVRPYFAIADCLVFPSYREGFPNVVMQAGAMGLPSIVTNINGCNEIVQQEENGIIIPVKDTEAILESMKFMLSETNTFNKMKQNSRKMILDRYEQNVVWEAILKEYQNTVGNV